MAYDEENQRSSEPKLCLNNCGFYGGGEATGNLCSKCHSNRRLLQLPAVTPHSDDPSEVIIEAVAADVAVKKRCATCGKKLGILRQFACKCKNTYCSAHRYPEDHSCEFDFKAAGRAQIERNNPVVKAEKITRI